MAFGFWSGAQPFSACLIKTTRLENWAFVTAVAAASDCEPLSTRGAAMTIDPTASATSVRNRMTEALIMLHDDGEGCNLQRHYMAIPPCVLY